MNRSILEQPFEGQLIKSRRGAFGKTISSVEGSEYIRRLNGAFEGEWSFTTRDTMTDTLFEEERQGDMIPMGEQLDALRDQFQ